MTHSLVSTNQVRANNIVVDDVPKVFDYNGTSQQAIIHRDTSINIPVQFIGPIPYIPVRTPTCDEMEECIHIHLTSPHGWDINLYPSLEAQAAAIFATADHPWDSREENLVAALGKTTSSSITPDHLSRMWSIDLKSALATLENTTHKWIRHLTTNHIDRQYKTLQRHQQYRQLSGYHGQFASDTFASNVTSTRGNKYFQLFANRGNFAIGTPITKKSKAPEALDRFLHDVDIPSELLTDGAKELHLARWGELCQRYSISQKLTEPYSPWQNHAKRVGGAIKCRVRNMMRQTQTFPRLWDYCWEYVINLRNLTCSDHIYTDKVSPFKKIYGYTPDISEYVQFEWVQWVHYHDPVDPDRVALGRWLGPAHTIGQGPAYHVLTENGTVKVCSTVKSIDGSQHQPDCDAFMQKVDNVIGHNAPSTIQQTDIVADDPYNNLFNTGQCDDDVFDPVETYGVRPLDDYVVEHPRVETDDKFIGCKINFPIEGKMIEGTVSNCKRDSDGFLLSTDNTNPLLDTRIYNVTFPDGSYREYTANLIAEAIIK